MTSEPDNTQEEPVADEKPADDDAWAQDRAARARQNQIDELKSLKGCGDGTAVRLVDAGITSIALLAEVSDDDVDYMLKSDDRDRKKLGEYLRMSGLPRRARQHEQPRAPKPSQR